MSTSEHLVVWAVGEARRRRQQSPGDDATVHGGEPERPAPDQAAALDAALDTVTEGFAVEWQQFPG